MRTLHGFRWPARVGARPETRNRMMRKLRGFTLVELLIAMTLSLVIVLALAQVFRVVGDSVMAGRAVVEMSSQLRSATDQLQRDLEGVTVPVRPWAEPGSGLGYIEAYEGPFWDLGLGAGAAGLPPAPPAPRVQPWYSESSVGDIDDVLMFTSCAGPFVGQVMASIRPSPSVPGKLQLYIDSRDPTRRETLESQVAEVVWFTRFNDRNRNGQPERGEVTLHRRAFLVLPNLDLSDSIVNAWDVPVSTLSPLQFYSAFDISVRTTQAGAAWGRVANSLEDLTRRENRIAHDVSGAYPPSPTTPNRLFPFLFWRGLLVPQGSVATTGADSQWGVRGVDDDGNGTTDDISEAGHFGSDDITRPIDVALPALPLAFAESYGSDLIFADVLAFDVQVYDPTVPVYQAVSGTDPVLPSDPGYDASGTLPRLGHGGYVDMFYGRYTGVLGTSLFSDPPLPRSGLQVNLPVFWGQPCYPAVYDPWSLSYEHDGIDEDGMIGLDASGLIDQGADGIDNDGVNGVDDVGERETSPPYPVPLRGIQVRMRIIDRDTRQVRQMTVSSDFIPE